MTSSWCHLVRGGDTVRSDPGNQLAVDQWREALQFAIEFKRFLIRKNACKTHILHLTLVVVATFVRRDGILLTRNGN